MNKHLTLLSLFIVLAAGNLFAQYPAMEIRGRIVDSANKPVENAKVTFYDMRCNGCTEMITIFAITDPEGRFRYQEASSDDPRMHVVAETRVPDGFWNPVDAEALSINGIKGFAAAVVEKNGPTDLGDIPLTVDYEKMPFRLAKAFKIDESAVTPEAIDSLRLKLWINGRKIPPTFIVPANAVSGGQLNIALAPGTWKLELSMKTPKKKIKAKLTATPGGVTVIE